MRTFRISGFLAPFDGTDPDPGKPLASRLRGHSPWHHLAGPTGAAAYEVVDRLVEGGLFDVDPRLWIGLQLGDIGLAGARRLKAAWIERQQCCREGTCPEHRPPNVTAADA